MEDKELLLIDLCARLPYGVKVTNGIHTITLTPCSDTSIIIKNEHILPYLRPMESMTDNELVAFLKIRGMNLSHDKLQEFRKNDFMIANTLSSYSKSIDWLNRNMFDYRGLIKMGLALEAKEGMYK